MVERPSDIWVDSITDTVPLIEANGWEHGLSQMVGNPYISCARADMLWEALRSKADVIVFLDYDIGWRPETMLKLLETEGDVVAGTYRFKKDEEEYMSYVKTDEDGYPIIRDDGCLEAGLVPAGFLKVTRKAIVKFMKGFPELVYGDPTAPHIDLFNHGARNGSWWGEDYSFCDRWCSLGEKIWLIPDIDLDHCSGDKIYKGNFHEFLLKHKGEKQ